jgi:hypothetical protein
LKSQPFCLRKIKGPLPEQRADCYKNQNKRKGSPLRHQMMVMVAMSFAVHLKTSIPRAAGLPKAVSPLEHFWAKM